MPIKGGRLTPKERLFARAYAETGDTVVAGKKAGYESHSGPFVAMQRPAVLHEIAEHQDHIFRGDLLPKATKVLNVILTDDRVPWGVKLQGAKFVIERCQDRGGDATKEPYEMTAEELAQAIAQLKATTAVLENARADRAKPVIDGAVDLFG